MGLPTWIYALATAEISQTTRFCHPSGARRMPLVNGLVPSRFLTLTAHLVIVITLFWSRENNVRASLPLQFTQEAYVKQDTEMVVALSVTLGLFAVELAGFLSGVSMFNHLQGLLSTGAHAVAALTLVFFLFEQWDGSQYWWIFAFCSALPAAVEVLLFISVFGLKKKPL
ncbi:transmembrane protein 107 isoform X1 [Heteronotia binoei]|uniref:transmembrane protein 107 isoform X1 n=1 Tax=Heteronotia binoei TaxID=13085 RepID=UPI00292D8753|nr:transmembrane protein 107 isoform X1 [Heteronotia binoei]